MKRKLVTEIYGLAWPVLIAQWAMMAYSVLDTVITGRYATEDLAAVGIGTSIYISVFMALMGVLIALSPTVAQLRGAGRQHEIGEQVRQAMWLAVALAALSMLIFAYPDPLLALSQVSPSLEAKVRSYLSFAAWGAPAGLGFRLFASYTTAVSLPRIVMTLTMLGLTIKAPLTWLLVVGAWGAPELGASGCALATTLTNYVVCAAAWAWCAYAPAYRPHAVFARWSWPRLHDLRHLVTLGIPIGMTFLVDVTAFTFMALFIARLGAINSAAHHLAGNVGAIMFMVPMATGTAVTVVVGQAIGARDFARARLAGITGIACAVVVAAVMGAVLWVTASDVARLYTSDAAVGAMAAGLFLLVAVYHVFDAAQVVTLNALRGYKRVVVPLAVTATALWGVGLAGGYVLGLTRAMDLSALGLTLPMGTPGFWLAAIIGMAASTLGLIVYFLRVSATHHAEG